MADHPKDVTMTGSDGSTIHLKWDTPKLAPTTPPLATGIKKSVPADSPSPGLKGNVNKNDKGDSPGKTPSLKGGASGSGHKPKTTGPPPMLEGTAKKWMGDFKDRRKDIPFNWPRDCCYTRAREMAKELAAEGFKPGKAWNYAPPSGPLRASTPNVKEGYIEWHYHVAPTLPIQRKDGSVVTMVIDPSLSDRPLTPQEWKGLQGQPDSMLVLTDASPYYRSPLGIHVDHDPGDAEVQKTLAKHRAHRAMEPH